MRKVVAARAMVKAPMMMVSGWGGQREILIAESKELIRDGNMLSTFNLLYWGWSPAYGIFIGVRTEYNPFWHSLY